MKPIEDVLSDARVEAATLRRNGHAAQAGSIERVCDQFSEHPLLRDLLAWIEEPEAMTQSGRGIAFFRMQFPQWESAGLAELRGRRRFYRKLIVPQRKLNSIQRAEARRSA